MTLFPDVHELMKQRGIGDRLLTGGGIIPPEDMDSLAKLGVGKLFGPGSSTQDIAHYIRDWFVARHGADALAPMPAAPAARSAAYPEVPRPAHARPAGAARPAAAPRRTAPKRAAGARRSATKRAAPKRTVAKRSSGARAARGAARAKSRRRR
jgi:hypothetical protein